MIANPMTDDEVNALRKATIEECAKVAESNGFSLTVASGAVGATIAAAIRALKDK